MFRKLKNDILLGIERMRAALAAYVDIKVEEERVKGDRLVGENRESLKGIANIMQSIALKMEGNYKDTAERMMVIEKEIGAYTYANKGESREVKLLIEDRYGKLYGQVASILVSDELNKLKNLENIIDGKFNKFHGEFIEKYFEHLNNFIRWNKEVALVSNYPKADVDITKLKQELMKPYTDEKWVAARAVEAERIEKVLNTQGEKIRQKRADLYEQYIKADRENKDNTELLRAQVEIMDEIIKGEV